MFDSHAEIIDSWTARLVANAVRLQFFIQVAVVCAVVLAGFGEILSNILPEDNRKIGDALWFLGIALAFLGSLILVFADRSAADILSDARNAVAAARKIQDANLKSISACEEFISIAAPETDFLERLYLLSVALREAIEVSVAQPAKLPDAVIKRIGLALDLLVADKTTLLGFEDESWNLQVYVINEEDAGLLDCVACRRPHQADADLPHRSRRIGVGHVGMAWHLGRELVESDLSLEESLRIFATPEDNQTDLVRVRAIASLPIRLANGPIIGMLAATSDVPGRLTPDETSEFPGDPVEALRVAAAAIAFFVNCVDSAARDEGDKSD